MTRIYIENRRVRKAVTAILLTVIFSLFGNISAFAEEIDVELTYTQSVHVLSYQGYMPGTNLDYQITPIENAPMPEGSVNGVYSFSTGGTGGSLDLKVNYSSPGFYKYQVTPVAGREEPNYIYSDEEYTVYVMVINAENDTLAVGGITIMDESNLKHDVLPLHQSYYYVEPYIRVEEPEEEHPLPPVQPLMRAAAAPAQAVITAEPVPAASPEATPSAAQAGTSAPTSGEEIGDEPVPQTVIRYWALLNLILAAVTVLLSLLDVIFYFVGKKKESEEEENNQDTAVQENDEEEEEKTKKKGIFRILSALTAIVSVIVFILTEDIRLPWKWVDKWTLLMVILLIVDLIFILLSRKKKRGSEEEENSKA